MKKNQAVRSRHAVVAAVLAVASQLAIAQTEPQVVITDSHARGLSLLGAEALPSEHGYSISAQISRSVMSGVLAPVALKLVVRDGDGAVKAEQVTHLGPAELPRRRLRNYQFEERLEVTPAAGDTVEISLGG